MDTQRLILFFVFSFSLFMLWQEWQREKNPPPPPVVASSAPAAPGATPGAPSGATAGATPDAASQKPTDVPNAPAGAAVPPTVATPAPAGQTITITTDLFAARINTAGAVIEDVALSHHHDANDVNKPYHVLQKTAERTFVAQSGLLGEGMPNHRTVWEALPGPRELAPGQDTLELRLKSTAANGDPVVKTLTFHRGTYVIDVAYEVVNRAAPTYTPYAYFQFTRDTKAAVPQSSWAPASYIGPVVYNEADKYKKVDFGEIDKEAADPTRKPAYTKKADNGWIGMVEHYFVTAFLPSDEAKTPREFYTRKLDGGLYAAGVIVEGKPVPIGGTTTIAAPLYVGPQDQDQLAKLAKGLDLVVDYGIFTVIAAPLFWLLKWLHGLLGNWGWAIVAMTILIKSAFYPLNHASARSMAKMKVIAPKLKALQEQYKDDKQQLQMKMMELYRTEKINPLGGCLPILVQIPVFIALYWVLLSAVELRHAPWIGWIHDLSAPDPWFILPIVYAITAYLQVRLSPTPISDPVQAKVMQIMPIAFSVMFIFFPAGLVLYWLINNCIQIFQQWHMNRVLEREAAAAAAKRR